MHFVNKNLSNDDFRCPLCARQRGSQMYSGSSVKCAVVLDVSCKRSWCTVDLCPTWPMWNHVEQRPTPPAHLEHSFAYSQATTDSVYLQPSRGMDLDGTNPGDSWAAQSVIRGYRIVYVYTVLNFSSSNTVSWNTPQMVYPHSTVCYYYGMKASTCVHHTSWAVSQALPLLWFFGFGCVFFFTCATPQMSAPSAVSSKVTTHTGISKVCPGQGRSWFTGLDVRSKFFLCQLYSPFYLLIGQFKKSLILSRAQ
jgi:hypothetical protein